MVNYNKCENCGYITTMKDVIKKHENKNLCPKCRSKELKKNESKKKA